MVHSSNWDQYINLVILNNTGGWGWSVGGWGPYFTWALPGNQYDSTQTHDWIFAYYTGYLHSGEKETRYGAISGLEDDKVIGLNQGITIDTTISGHTYWKIEYYFEVHMLRPAGSVVFKYLGNEATGGSTASNFAVYGSNFTFQVNGFTRTGYEFYRWALSINGNFIGYYSSGQLYGTWTITNSDAIALAIWSGNTYTIYYYMTGGEDGGTTPENTAIYGSNFTFQANGYTKTGYTFYRWLVRDNNYSFIGYYNAGQLYGIWDRLSNHHAFAQWSAKKYTITYDANGGSGTLATNPQTATYDSSFTFQANVFTKIGYTFFKWELYDSGGSTRLNKEYDSGQSYGTWNIPYNIIAKAQWQGNTYQITYKANGGIGNDSSENVIYGNNMYFKNSNFYSRIGYDFKEWRLEDSSNNLIALYVGNDLVAVVWNIAKNVTANAQWTAKTYEITIDKGGGTGTISNKTSATYDSPFTFPSNAFLTKTGHTFSGWWLYKNNARQGVNTTYNSEQAYGNWNLDGTTFSVVAQWTAKEYTIIYEGNGNTGGIQVNSNKATYGNNFTFNTNTFTRIGYEFSGWHLYDGTTRINPTSKYGPTTYSYGTTWDIDKNVTAQAQWTQGEFTVTFNTNGKGGTNGTGYTKTIKQNYNTLVTCPIVTAVGYVFGGWATSAASAIVNKLGNATFTLGAADQSFFAIWTVNTNGTRFSELQSVFGGTDPIQISEYRTQSSQTTANSEIRLGIHLRGKSPPL